jgi:hemerythrin-like domain-containing protein
MNEIRPIKRSEQLAPLSREHHDALLFIWKIKKGLKNKTSIQIIASYVQWFWNNHLKEHFDQEEKILLPFLSKNKMTDQLKKEHETIRNLITAEMDESSIALLANTLNDHIRFEERQLFPDIEKEVSVEQLNEIFKQLDHQPQCETYAGDEFWIPKK